MFFTQNIFFTHLYLRHEHPTKMSIFYIFVYCKTCYYHCVCKPSNKDCLIFMYIPANPSFANTTRATEGLYSCTFRNQGHWPPTTGTWDTNTCVHRFCAKNGFARNHGILQIKSKSKIQFTREGRFVFQVQNHHFYFANSLSHYLSVKHSNRHAPPLYCAYSPSLSPIIYLSSTSAPPSSTNNHFSKLPPFHIFIIELCKISHNSAEQTCADLI